MLVGLSSIPMGAADITDDIAAAFSTRREHAERLKCFYGSATNSPRDNHEMIEIMPLSEDDGAEPGRVTRSQLISVIRQRLDLLLGDIGARLNDMGFRSEEPTSALQSLMLISYAVFCLQKKKTTILH